MVSAIKSKNAALAGEIAAFRNYLKAERGMALNTVLAYGRDLDRFSEWVAGSNLKDYLGPTVRELTQYLSYLREEGLEPASTARHLVALKMFYRFFDWKNAAIPSPSNYSVPLHCGNGYRRCSARRALKNFLPPRKRPTASSCATGPSWKRLYATGSRASEVVGLKLAGFVSGFRILQVPGQRKQATRCAFGQTRSGVIAGVLE